MTVTVIACGGRDVVRPSSGANLDAATSPVASLHAFARLYGVVRWFHPSDAAATVDWNSFVIDGVRSVLRARSVRELRADLSRQFAPISPTVRYASAGESLAEPANASALAGQDFVAWQHLGFGDSTVVSVYMSKRRHRDRAVPVEGFPRAAMFQAFDAIPYRGLRVRVRGQLRTAAGARGRLFLRIEHNGTATFLEMMDRSAITSAVWKTAEIIAPIDPEATHIAFGPVMTGLGTTWYDDLSVEVQHQDGQWTSLPLNDLGFESGGLSPHWRPGMATSLGTLDGWSVTFDSSLPAEGTASLRVEPAMKLLTEDLFSEAPSPGEVADIDLGSGIRAQVPLSLLSKDGRTVGDDLARVTSGPAAEVSSNGSFDVLAGIADVIVVWNVLQHFWPYWEYSSTDWLKVLDTALANALDDRTVVDHVDTLTRLLVELPDAHMGVLCPGDGRTATTPFAVDVIEDRVVVTETRHSAVHRGDQVISIDGEPAMARLAAEAALISGTSQWKRVRARTRLVRGLAGSPVTVRLRRAETELDVSLVRGSPVLESPRRPPIERLDDGVYYVDVSRIRAPDLAAAIERVAAAPGVIFDVRGQPSPVVEVLSHLLTRPDDAKWLLTPRVIRPDHTRDAIPSWEPRGFDLQPREPHIRGRVAFLMGPATSSAGESIMMYVDHYRLGERVGATTAGTNGNRAEITTPSGCIVAFTGQRVPKLDGSRFHLVGIEPTIPASRTIAGVIAGRDEVFETALAYVRGATKPASPSPATSR